MRALSSSTLLRVSLKTCGQVGVLQHLPVWDSLDYLTALCWQRRRIQGDWRLNTWCWSPAWLLNGRRIYPTIQNWWQMAVGEGVTMASPVYAFCILLTRLLTAEKFTYGTDWHYRTLRCGVLIQPCFSGQQILL